MAIFPRVSFFFNDREGQGWGETYYSTSGGDLSTVRTAAEKLALLRVGLIKNGPQLHYGRVSFDDVAGDSLLITVPKYLQDGSYKNDLQDDLDPYSDVSTSCMLLRMSSGSLYRKSLFLPGNPDSIQSGGPTQIKPNEFWRRNFKKYTDELTSGAWGIKSIAKDLTNAPERVVTNFNGGTGLVTAANHGYAVGDKIRISGAKSNNANQKKLNGIYTVSAVVTADTFRIGGWNLNELFDLTGVAKSKKRVHIIVPIDSVLIRKLTSHKRGSFFGQSRGRQRKRS